MKLNLPARIFTKRKPTRCSHRRKKVVCFCDDYIHYACEKCGETIKIARKSNRPVIKINGADFLSKVK